MRYNLALNGVLLVAACGTVLSAATHARAETNFRQLRLQGGLVQWSTNGDHPRRLSYAFATSRRIDSRAINCRSIVPLTGLISRSKLEMHQMRRAAAEAFLRWEAAANLEFVETSDETKADILIGGQSKPRGIAFANVVLSAQRDGRRRYVEKARICLNPKRSWKIGFNGNLDVYDLVHTLTHEIGHTLGLDHPNGPGALMSFQYREELDGLTAGDTQGVRMIYGPPKSEKF